MTTITITETKNGAHSHCKQWEAHGADIRDALSDAYSRRRDSCSDNRPTSLEEYAARHLQTDDLTEAVRDALSDATSIKIKYENGREVAAVLLSNNDIAELIHDHAENIAANMGQDLKLSRKEMHAIDSARRQISYVKSAYNKKCPPLLLSSAVAAVATMEDILIKAGSDAVFSRWSEPQG